MCAETQQSTDKASEHNGVQYFPRVWSCLRAHEQEWCQLRLIVFILSLFYFLRCPLSTGIFPVAHPPPSDLYLAPSISEAILHTSARTRTVSPAPNWTTSQLPYLSFFIWYRLNTHEPPPPSHPISLSTQNIASPCLFISCLPSRKYLNDGFSSPLFLLPSALLF